MGPYQAVYMVKDVSDVKIVFLTHIIIFFKATKENSWYTEKVG